MSLKPRPSLVWNATVSTPIGHYRVDRTDTFAVGDLVIAIPPDPIVLRTADFFLAAFPSSSVFLPSLGKPFVVPDSSSWSAVLQWEPLATTIDMAGLYLIGKGAAPFDNDKV